jgi:hypothetical protein
VTRANHPDSRRAARQRGGASPRLLAAAAAIAAIVGVTGFAVLRWAFDIERKPLPASTAPDEREAQRAYEWLAETAAALDAKRATIETMAAGIRDIEARMGDAAPASWPRHVFDEHRQSARELRGVVQSYNRVAAEYNAEMARWKERFATRQGLPAGATRPLPRTFEPHAE